VKKLSKIVACFSLLAVLALGACNTVEGMGQDLSAMGDGISDASRDASNTRGY
jgi:predicted small secreted protein